MAGAISASELRRDVYRLLDEALATGRPIEIERRGRRLRIVPEPDRPHWHGFQPDPQAVVVDLDTIDDIDWMVDWGEGRV